jgi:hypothetical protein
MSISESDRARRIAQHLDHALEQIEPATLERLQSARLAAVGRMRPQPASQLAWARAGNGRTMQRYLSPRYLLPIVAMVLTIPVMVYWQQQGRTENPVEIDAKLLSSEVPIDALLDKGLDQWLQH